MTGRVLVPAEDVWNYITEQLVLFKTDDPAFAGWDLAYNDSAGLSVSVVFEDDMQPCLALFEDEEMVSSFPVFEADCEEVAQQMYDDFISDRVFSRDDETPLNSDDPPDIHDMQTEEMEDRESELTDSVYEMLLTFLENQVDTYDIDALIEDCKDHLCEWLSEEWGADIRRPMLLENENGEEMFTEHPYDYLLTA